MRKSAPDRLALVHGLERPVGFALQELLAPAQWTLADAGPDLGTDASEAGGRRSVDGLIYDPGLLDPGCLAWSHDDVGRVVGELGCLVDLVAHRLRSRDDGGTGIVVVGSRDALGWEGRSVSAAANAALIAFARSLALEMGKGRSGVTVNVVLGPSPPAVPDEDAGHPRRLTSEVVTASDIAEVVAFFIEPGNRYVTGQAIYACGGSDLLSSPCA